MKDEIKFLASYKYARDARWISLCGLFMAVNVVFSSFSVPVPGGHLYLNDMVIAVAAVVLDPLGAALVGGIGCFLGDFFFYPDPMFVSLAIHLLSGFTVSYCMRNAFPDNPKKGAVLGTVIAGLIVIVGYTLGKTFVYRTYEYAMLKLPWECLQAVANVVLAYILCWNLKLPYTFAKMLKK